MNIKSLQRAVPRLTVAAAVVAGLAFSIGRLSTAVAQRLHATVPADAKSPLVAA